MTLSHEPATRAVAKEKHKLLKHLFFTTTMASVKTWACHLCTYENQASSKLCEMCGTNPKSANKDISSGGQNEWKCVLWYVLNICYVFISYVLHYYILIKKTKNSTVVNQYHVQAW